VAWPRSKARTPPHNSPGTSPPGKRVCRPLGKAEQIHGGHLEPRLRLVFLEELLQVPVRFVSAIWPPEARLVKHHRPTGGDANKPLLCARLTRGG